MTKRADWGAALFVALSSLLPLLDGCASAPGPSSPSMPAQRIADISDLSEADARFVEAARDARSSGRITERHRFAEPEIPERPAPLAETLEANGVVLQRIDAVDLTDLNTTGPFETSYWRSSDGHLYVRVRGGCAVYVDVVYGPFVVRDGELAAPVAEQ